MPPRSDVFAPGHAFWNAGPFRYRAHGFSIASEIALPELPELRAGGEAVDLRIRLGSTPDALDAHDAHGVCFQAREDQYLLTVDGVARYLVRDGTEIVIEPVQGADVDSVRLFLLQVAFGALLDQRNLLVLHGSAISSPRGAILFLGQTATGKSTLAAALASRGYGILSDALCVVTTGEEGPMVLPAYPGLQLWRDALEALGLADQMSHRIRPNLDKHHTPLNDRFHAAAMPVQRIYLLSPVFGGGMTLRPVTGLDKAVQLSECAFARSALGAMDASGARLRQILHLAQAVPVSQAKRPDKKLCFETFADLVERDFAA